MAVEINTETSERSWRLNTEDGSAISGAELVGYYSTDRLKTYLPDSSRLRYYKSSDREDVYFDLNKGLEWAIPGNYSSGDRRLLFSWIKFNHNKIKAPADTDRWIEPNFACTGGLLSHLLCACYTSNEHWTIRAAKWRGTIYLTFAQRTTQIPRGCRQPPYMLKKYGSWLQKFVQYVVSDSPDEAPDPSRPVCEPDEFRCVYKIKFGQYSVLFDKPMKGVTSEKKMADPLPLKELKFVHLQLNKKIESEKQERSFRRYKHLKWWSFGFMTNTEEILCGFRNDAGIVQKVKTFSLEEIVENSKNDWKPRTCIEYCESFFKKVAETVVNECDETIYDFEKRPNWEELSIWEFLGSYGNTVIPPYFMQEIL